MKKIVFFVIILLIAILIPRPIQSQNINWVGLKSDASAITTPGQLILVQLNGSLTVPITEAALTLRYDPTCFRVTSHHPGSLLPGATAFAQAQSGQFDLSYYFQDNGHGNTGEGSLMNIQLEALKMCTSDLSVAPGSILLGMLDAKGNAVKLSNVEYRTLTLHLPQGLTLVTTQVPATRITQTAAQPSLMDNTYIFLLLLILLPIAGAAIYVLLRRRPKPTRKLLPAPAAALPENKIPTLTNDSQTIELSQPHTQLGLHTKIIQRAGFFYLADTGSQNGTFLNGEQIGPGYHFLHDGDQIQMGHTVPYVFVKPPQERPVASTTYHHRTYASSANTGK